MRIGKMYFFRKTIPASSTETFRIEFPQNLDIVYVKLESSGSLKFKENPFLSRIENSDYFLLDGQLELKDIKFNMIDNRFEIENLETFDVEFLILIGVP